MEIELEWVDEPPAGAAGKESSERWNAIAAELKKRPRQWALVAKNVNRATADQIRTGKIKAFQEGLWEATTRGGVKRGYTEFGRCDLYVRYLGPWTEGE